MPRGNPKHLDATLTERVRQALPDEIRVLRAFGNYALVTTTDGVRACVVQLDDPQGDLTWTTPDSAARIYNKRCKESQG